MIAHVFQISTEITMSEPINTFASWLIAIDNPVFLSTLRGIRFPAHQSVLYRKQVGNFSLSSLSPDFIKSKLHASKSFLVKINIFNPGYGPFLLRKLILRKLHFGSLTYKKSCFLFLRYPTEV